MSSPAETVSRTSGTPPAAAVAPVRLPVQLSSFIGRETGIARVREMLGTTRLLTLTGTGGSGKTRLALEVAAQVAQEYSDGLAWVELAPLSDPDLLPQQIATTLGIREEGGRSATEALLAFLRERSLLLVLDNCEHLADACAALAETLLRGGPGLKLLATSREALGVAGERAWLVPPLTLPAADAATSPEQLAGFEAVQLFLERAQDVLPSFALTEQNAEAVAQICRRLDGIPLALELAAARVKVLTPEQIAQRLDNAFGLLTSGSRTALPRHRTLRAAMDWSYQLLFAPEQLLLQRLSVFAGGFTLEAAEAVCADEILEAWEVLDLLSVLVDKSLVLVQEGPGAVRYRLLETVRQYAGERLRERGESDAVQRRHAEFFAALAQLAEPHLLGPRRTEWGRRLLAEQGNLRAALAWTLAETGDGILALRLAANLWWFWHYVGAFAEARRWLEAALRLPEAAAPSRERAWALYGAAGAAWFSGDAASGCSYAEEGAVLCRSLGDSRGLVCVLTILAFARRDTGDLDEARRVAAECVELAEQSDALLTERALALLSLAGIHVTRGEYVLGRQINDESESLWREARSNWGLSQALHGKAMIALALGELEEAMRACREALAVLREEDDVFCTCRVLEGMATIRGRMGDASVAARLLGAAEALREPIGAPVLPFEKPRYDQTVAAVRAALGPESFTSEWRQGRTLRLQEAIAFAIAIVAPAPPPPPAAAIVSPPVPPPASLPLVEREQESAPAPLAVRALGPLEIFRDGEPLPPEVWRMAKPRELLVYLLSHPEGRTKQQIGLVFWPESSPAQVRNSFHVMLHHLRKALGHSEWIVLENERYRLDPEVGVEFDATLFEQQITAALQEARSGSGSMESLRSALARYRGDFLQDETVGDWHLEMRDRLGRLYVEGLSALGELLMRSEAYAEAAGIYQQIVRREDLHEEAHRKLMLCLAHTGERARALRHYERLVRLLAAELDTEPDEETTALYEQLRQAEPV